MKALLVLIICPFKDSQNKFYMEALPNCNFEFLPKNAK